MAKRPTDADISSVMAELGRRGAAALNGALTPEERRKSAKKAAAARWGWRSRSIAGKNGTAAALETETELAESTSQKLKKL